MKPPFGSKPRALFLWLAVLATLALLPCLIFIHYVQPWPSLNGYGDFFIAVGILAALICIWQSIQLIRHAFSVPKGLPLKISSVLLCFVLCVGIGVSVYDFCSYSAGGFYRAVLQKKDQGDLIFYQEPFEPVRINCTAAIYNMLEEGKRYSGIRYETRRLTGENYLTMIFPASQPSE